MRIAARAIIVKDDHLLVIHRNKFGTEYYTLPGGGVEEGEEPEEAVVRELDEETSVTANIVRHVFTEEPGEQFGRQIIFLCEYVAGEPAVHPDSEEALSNAAGGNLYTPMWLPLDQIANVPFRSSALQAALQDGFKNGFPPEVVML